MYQGVSKLKKFPHGCKILKCRYRNRKSGNPNTKSMRLLDGCLNEARKNQKRYYRYFLTLVWYSWHSSITTSFVKFYLKYNSLLWSLSFDLLLGRISSAFTSDKLKHNRTCLRKERFSSECIIVNIISLIT